MKVPFGDLRREWGECGVDIRSAIDRVLESGWFILGKELEGFERAFSAFLGDVHVIGVGSGTEALHLALVAAGVESGDFVITVPNTAVPTVSAISAAGATPLLVDVEERGLTMDPAQLHQLLVREKPRLGKRLKAVVPVHLYGRVTDMDGIVRVAKEFDIAVIEDAAQAHGAAYRGSKAGTIGDLAAFSFYPSKNLGCYGDGGAVVTHSEDQATHLKMLRNYGQHRRYYHEIKGVNSRLDEVQAAILTAKLPFLSAWTLRRRAIAHMYDELIDNPEVVKPPLDDAEQHVFHLYVMRHAQRDRLISHLERCGVGTVVHYPIPVHLQHAYADLGYGRGAFPVSETAAAQVVSLPIFPQLTDDEVAYVAKSVNSFGG
jgi:dTDP-4-amino-4,6-dideoxygalactose transaminase